MFSFTKMHKKMLGIKILIFFNIYRDVIVDSLQFMIKLAQHRQRLNILVKYLKQDYNYI